ncbi:hypothetical protein J2Z76_001913 [Sedimentibacter acidaminivorans]|uniref:DUF5320 domain-containing protein n=1 Tax=Sedimentibacter acidaminivorans TaxID=913099 RepID=A0ABS4GEH2_9FIRM|nr:DUF5320 domain-containing protein [Sedimentibacter acidaminivorans]MBP1926049.1 hypothetical protein [Sedimentibacter acidaminivorans]
MPNRDGTGPNSMGSMTGRGLGICAGINGVNFGFGRGRAFGCGRGFGRNFISNNNIAKSQKELLEEQKLIFEKNLKVVKEQLEKL